MPDQERMAEAAERSLVRTAIREYAKYKLFAPAPRGGQHDPLTLPRRGPVAAFSEADVYTSRPGAQDRKRTHQEGDPDIRINHEAGFVDILIGYSGLNEVESLANAAMGSIGPLAQQLVHPAPSYRAFLARELRDARAAPLFIEHPRVWDAFRRLTPRYQEALRDIDQSHEGRLSIKAIARKRGQHEATIRALTLAACDALADLLYALYDVRPAA